MFSRRKKSACGRQLSRNKFVMSRIRVLSGKHPIYTNLDINMNTHISYIFIDFLIYVPIYFPIYFWLILSGLVPQVARVPLNTLSGPSTVFFRREKNACGRQLSRGELAMSRIRVLSGKRPMYTNIDIQMYMHIFIELPI